MNHDIRPLREADIEPVLALAIRAWEPVFESVEAILGTPTFTHLRGKDWRAGQRDAVHHACTTDDFDTWVVEVDGDVAGFVAVQINQETQVGQIYLVAVDPAHQHQGLGFALTDFAVGVLKEAGMPVAMVHTGGDPGHAPGRRVFEKAGFRPFPVVDYYKQL